MSSLPRIAVTMGDPAGIGPEICLRLLADPFFAGICDPIVFGDRIVLEAAAERTGLPLPESGDGLKDLGAIDLADFTPGTVNAATGKAGFQYVEKAIQAALAKEVTAVVTAPLNKEALRDAGVPFPGHTEIFAAMTKAERACMLQTCEIISASFVTVHVGYHEVPKLLTVERIIDVIELTRDAMRRIRGREPKLAVCGLNPHAGENGLFGDGEEEKFIVPAIEAVRQQGADIEGPLPPDTAFIEPRRAVTDAVVCMYHDQGHIPVKALAFDQCVNTTLGLPFPRTSVDHGTALDIAWQGKANPSSLFEAVKLAAKLGCDQKP